MISVEVEMGILVLAPEEMAFLRASNPLLRDVRVRIPVEHMMVHSVTRVICQ